MNRSHELRLSLAAVALVLVRVLSPGIAAQPQAGRPTSQPADPALARGAAALPHPLRELSR